MPTIDSSTTPAARHTDPGLARSGTPDAIGPSDRNGPHGGRVDGGSPGGQGAVVLDDDEIMSGRGNNARTGGTDATTGGDSGRLGPPSEQRSGSNGPDDSNREG